MQHKHDQERLHLNVMQLFLMLSFPVAKTQTACCEKRGLSYTKQSQFSVSALHVLIQWTQGGDSELCEIMVSFHCAGFGRIKLPARVIPEQHVDVG